MLRTIQHSARPSLFEAKGSATLGKLYAECVNFAETLLEEAAPAEGETVVVPQFKWINVAVEGLYEGHPDGDFDLTAAVLQEFVDALHSDPRYVADAKGLGSKKVIPFDYEHASEMNPTEGSIPMTGAGAPAWVFDMEVRKGTDGKAQLWAYAKLGKKIRQQIADEEYAFTSIAFTLDATDPKSGTSTGARISSIAFTNHPFLREILDIAASSKGKPKTGRSADEAHKFYWYDTAGSPEQGIEYTRKMLGIPVTSDTAAVISEIAKVAAFAAAPDTTPPGVKVDEIFCDLRKIWGLSVTSTVEEIIAEITKAGAAITAAAALAESKRAKKLAEGAPTVYAVGDSVLVVAGSEHLPEHAGVEGVVDLVEGGAYGVLFDGIDGVYKWYLGSELEAGTSPEEELPASTEDQPAPAAAPGAMANDKGGRGRKEKQMALSAAHAKFSTLILSAKRPGKTQPFVLAEDAAVEAAVQETVANSNDLSTVLEAFGLANVAELLKAIPELMGAKGRLTAVMAALDEALTVNAAVEASAEVADVAAAMSQNSWTDVKLTKALTLSHKQFVSDELAKIPEADRKSIKALTAARTTARTAFFAEYGVPEEARAVLLTSLVAGPGGKQLKPPVVNGGRIIPLREPKVEGEPLKINLSGCPGANRTQRLMSWIRSNEKSFQNSSHDKIHQRASELNRLESDGKVEILEEAV